MKICTVSYHSCPYSPLGGNGAGGMSVYLRELSARLTEIPGFQMDIFTRILDKKLPAVSRISDSLKIIHLPAGPPVPMDRTELFGYLPEFIRMLQEYINAEKKKYDVIYSHYWLSGLAGEWLKNTCGIPLVHTFHTLSHFKEKVLGRAEGTIRQMAENHLMAAADNIISSSEQERKYLTEIGGVPKKRISVIYPGVNPNMFKPAEAPGDIRILRHGKNDILLLFVGRIEPVKGLDTVVRGLVKLNRTDPLMGERIRLAVVGGGRAEELELNPEVKIIKQLIKKNGIESYIHFLGSREQKVLNQYYSAADAFVVPSLYESFGLVVAEALSCGTPVLGSCVGEINRFIKEKKNGFCFCAGDEDAFIDSLKKFVDLQAELWPAEKIRENIMKALSWKKTARNVGEILRSAEIREGDSTTRLQPGGMPRPV